MAAVVTKTQNRDVIQESAVVLANEPCRVRGGGGVEYVVERAASCLMKPQVGDEVLVCLLPDRRAFVLAVLVRDGVRKTEISVDGDLSLRAEHGCVEIAASEGVSVVTPRNVEMVAGKLSIRAVAAVLASEAITMVGKTVHQEVDRVKLVARTLDTTLERFTQRAKQSFRLIQETDHLRAERVDYVAEKSITMHGEHAIVTAQELVKVDGGQIHLG